VACIQIIHIHTRHNMYSRHNGRWIYSAGASVATSPSIPIGAGARSAIPPTRLLRIGEPTETRPRGLSLALYSLLRIDTYFFGCGLL
jgi:hypothetical protein